MDSGRKSYSEKESGAPERSARKLVRTMTRSIGLVLDAMPTPLRFEAPSGGSGSPGHSVCSEKAPETNQSGMAMGWKATEKVKGDMPQLNGKSKPWSVGDQEY